MKETAAWWDSVLEEFVLESHHLRLLQKACEAWDRSEQAREALLKLGMTYQDRFDCPRARPEIGIERDSRRAFAVLVREIGMDVSLPNENRIAPLRGNR